MAPNATIITGKVALEPDRPSVDHTAKEISSIFTLMEQEFNRVSKITWGELEDYSHATYKDVSDTWEKTTKEMKGIAGKSLWGTVTAWFEDDMDQVEGIWDNAWNSMIGSADKAWDGALKKAARRLQCLRHKSKGPEIFPGALWFSMGA